ncbi:MAG: glucans biosynthesis glucosyltransferase MdoH [Burkholderiaceae bacterium]
MISAPSSAPTAPPVVRAFMPSRPWVGLLRGSLMALLDRLPGLKFVWREPAVPVWAEAAGRRRRTLLLVVILFATMAAALLTTNAPSEPSIPWILYAGLGVLLMAWVGAGTATALMGAKVLLLGDRYALKLNNPRAPIDVNARTAVIMPICNEDIATVFSGLRATCESIAATGALGLFDFYLLSDSTDPAIRAAELKAWERLRTLLGDNPVGAGARVFYRLRRRRTMRKAGNVADFCRRWGKGYRYMIVLDADSTMHGDTLVSLVRLMEEHPKAGIVQTLPQAYGHNTLHARVQQFASRVTGRLFALGMAYWQLGESHYWGHNAILRVEPFMQHCALAPIKGRGSLAGDILSHDFVEAAMMGRAGYEVWLAPQLEGSWEQLPPNLLDELDRDRRWCRGNLQNTQLIAEPGWRPVHRVMFAVGSLSYVMGPIWLVFVALGMWAGSQEGANGGHAAAALWLLTLALLLLPRMLGVMAARMRGEHKIYGGTPRLIMSAVIELCVSALQAPVRMLAYSAYVLSTFTGLRLEWRSPPRDASSVSWRDAFARLGLFCTPLLLLALWVFSSEELAAPHLAPLWLPLLVAVPLAVLTSHEKLGMALRRLRMLLVPDEVRTPATLANAIARRGFADLMPMPEPVVAAPVAPVPMPARAKPRTARATPPRMLMPWSMRAGPVFASIAIFMITTLTPPFAQTPALPSEVRLQIDVQAALANQSEQIEQAQFFVAGGEEVKRPRVRARPARMIDDEVRQRAREAVRRSLSGEEEVDAALNGQAYT